MAGSYSTRLTSNIMQIFPDVYFNSMFDAGSIAGSVGQCASSVIKNFGQPNQYSKSSCEVVPLENTSAGFNSNLLWCHLQGLDRLWISANRLSTWVLNLVLVFGMWYKTMKKSAQKFVLWNTIRAASLSVWQILTAIHAAANSSHNTTAAT